MDKPSPTWSDDASSISADASTGAANGAAMPVLREIRRWCACARWANRRMLAACDTLDTEALRRDVGSSFGSVLGTLEHVYGADWLWLQRWQGRSPTAWPARHSHRAPNRQTTSTGTFLLNWKRGHFY